MKELRVAVFIDYQNFISTLIRKIKEEVKRIKKKPTKTEKDIARLEKFRDLKNDANVYRHLSTDMWQRLNPFILKALKPIFRSDVKFDHMGSYISLGIRENTLQNDEDKTKLKILKSISKLNGFIVKFELTKDDISYSSITNVKAKQKDLGVDARIVCQMLLGAFRDNYDVGVLLSDDQDFIPAIEIIQNDYGKKIIHLGTGIENKASCYGSISLKSFFNHVFPKEN